MILNILFVFCLFEGIMSLTQDPSEDISVYNEPIYSPPYVFNHYHEYPSSYNAMEMPYSQLSDINGDGLMDWVISYDYKSSGTREVWLNDGCKFVRLPVSGGFRYCSYVGPTGKPFFVTLRPFSSRTGGFKVKVESVMQLLNVAFEEYQKKFVVLREETTLAKITDAASLASNQIIYLMTEEDEIKYIKSINK